MKGESYAFYRENTLYPEKRFMFKAVFQQNEDVLKGFLASLLNLPVSHIRNVHIENPMILGKNIYGKEIWLDIRLTLNNRALINIEMQVLPQPFWINRSLTYLCRLYNQLKSGESYGSARQVIHIAIIDFQLFDGESQFYSQNRFMDKKTHRIYSDNLCLNVLSLKHIENATPEERASGLYEWGRLFAASTWEELKMLSEDNRLFKEVEETMQSLSQDEDVMDICHMREFDLQMQEYDRKMLEYERRMHQQMKRINAQLQNDNALLQNDNAQLQNDNALLHQDNQQLHQEVERLKSLLAKQNHMSDQSS